MKFFPIYLECSDILFNFAATKISYNMTKDECINLLKKYTDILKSKYGITSLSLFGSTARGEQKKVVISICLLTQKRLIRSY